jgi:hypothetical protein
MSQKGHFEILKQGAEAWNKWIEENRELLLYFGGVNLNGIKLPDMDLAGINLRGADLYNADFSRTNLQEASFYRAHLLQANLCKANLHGANFYRADLQVANLREANLVKADLSCTNLSEADLRGANLTEANLGVANLNSAQLEGTNLTNSVMGWSTLGGVDLSAVKGLDTVQHKGPSSVGVDTIYRSKGKIPESFLRGAGVPDMFITYAASLIGKAIQYYSCFISYSSKDSAFAQRLHTDLQQNGVHCWFAPEDMKIGAKIRPTIDHSIRIHDKLLLILSEHSINSTWVEKEVETAFEEEDKRKQTVLFPVRLDKAMMDTDQAWAADIRRTRHIGDFSRWKDHDAYQEAFARLLRDLKEEKRR